MVAEPLPGVVHALQEQALTFNLLQAHLAVVFAGDAYDQRIVHRAQQGAFQQELTGGLIDAVEHFIHQVIGEVAGIDPRQTTGGLLRRAVVMSGRQGNQLQGGGPACHVVAQAAAFGHFDWGFQATVKELLRFLMGKGELLAAHFQQLIAHAQVGNAQLRQVTRQDHQGQVFRLVAQEKAHRLMDNRIGDQMVVINDQVERAVPFGQLDKQLGKQGREAGVLTLLHHHFAGHTVSVGRLLNGGDQIAGKTLLLVVALIKGVPAEIGLTGSPL